MRMCEQRGSGLDDRVFIASRDVQRTVYCCVRGRQKCDKRDGWKQKSTKRWRWLLSVMRILEKVRTSVGGGKQNWGEASV